MIHKYMSRGKKSTPLFFNIYIYKCIFMYLSFYLYEARVRHFCSLVCMTITLYIMNMCSHLKKKLHNNFLK